MLNGAQLGIALTSVLVAAFLLGWLFHILWARLGRNGSTDRSQVSILAHRLHDAEEALAQAQGEVARLTEHLARCEAEWATQFAAAEARFAADLSGRETELSGELREARAEAQAVAEGLGTARRYISQLEARLRD